MKNWLKTATAAMLLVLLLVAQHKYTSSQLAARVDQLESDKTRLEEYVQRLTATRRVAQVNVLDQYRDEMDRTVTRLLWQEIAADGLLAPPIEIEAIGRLVYFEALVIKFEHSFVEHADPQRGLSLALFRRVFGDQQAPESAKLLSPPLPPDAGGSALGAADAQQWQRFWDMMDDPKQASHYGVRVAQCEAPAVPLSSGQIWEVTLDADGGLNLKRRTDAPASLTPPNPAPS